MRLFNKNIHRIIIIKGFVYVRREPWLRTKGDYAIHAGNALWKEEKGCNHIHLLFPQWLPLAFNFALNKEKERRNEGSCVDFFYNVH